jgi:hypothetical protein
VLRAWVFSRQRIKLTSQERPTTNQIVEREGCFLRDTGFGCFCSLSRVEGILRQPHGSNMSRPLRLARTISRSGRERRHNNRTPTFSRATRTLPIGPDSALCSKK